MYPLLIQCAVVVPSKISTVNGAFLIKLERHARCSVGLVYFHYKTVPILAFCDAQVSKLMHWRNVHLTCGMLSFKLQ